MIKIPSAREELPEILPFEENCAEYLGVPVNVGDVRIPNRIVYQPMEGCDGDGEGTPGELTRRRYMRFASGGPGLVWFEATAVVPEGRANPRQMMITEKNLSEYAELVFGIKSICMSRYGYEPVVLCQLTHSGRYSKPQGVPAPMAACRNPIFEERAPLPDGDGNIVSDDYLDSLGEKYLASARLCKRAGFDGVDIKACHRYLLSELLSAYTRPGRYGTDYEGRTRLFRETVGLVAGELLTPDFIVTSRFNAYDGFRYPYGFGSRPEAPDDLTPELSDAVRLVGDLYASGVRLLDMTMGNPYFNPQVNRPSSGAGDTAYDSVVRLLDGCRTLKKSAPDMKFICSGLSFLGTLAGNVAAGGVRDGWFDLGGFGRMTLAYPELAADILGGGLKKDRLCLTCGKCTELMRSGMTPGCVVRDRPIYSDLYHELAEAKRNGKQ